MYRAVYPGCSREGVLCAGGAYSAQSVFNASGTRDEASLMPPAPRDEASLEPPASRGEESLEPPASRGEESLMPPAS